MRTRVRRNVRREPTGDPGLDAAYDEGFDRGYWTSYMTWERLPVRSFRTVKGATDRGMVDGYRTRLAEWADVDRLIAGAVSREEFDRDRDGWLRKLNNRATVPEPIDPEPVDLEEVRRVLAELGEEPWALLRVLPGGSASADPGDTSNT